LPARSEMLVLPWGEVLSWWGRSIVGGEVTKGAGVQSLVGIRRSEIDAAEFGARYHFNDIRLKSGLALRLEVGKLASGLGTVFLWHEQVFQPGSGVYLVPVAGESGEQGG